MKYFNIRVIIALVVLAAVLYFAIGAVGQQTYAGEELSFTTSGIATVVNTGDEPFNLIATSGRSFTISTDDPDMRTLRAVREGSGRTAVYTVAADLSGGTTELRVTRGSDVNFAITADSAIQATVAARDAAGNRNILIAAAVVSLGLLFYMSNTTDHAWVKMLRQRAAGRKASAGGEVGATST